MKDLGTIPQTDSPERDAIAALVRRIQYDADVAFLIGPFTETYERLLVAVQHIHGIDAPTARAMLRKRTSERTRIATLGGRVDRLEALLDERCPGWRDEGRGEGRGEANMGDGRDDE